MAEAVLVVFTRCSDPAREAEFNKWYDEVHFPDVLAVPHVVSAQRFKLSGPASQDEGDAQYLAVYELDTDDTKAVMGGLNAGSREWAAAGRVIDCLQVVSVKTYTATGAPQRAKAGAAGD
jgi:hypothetical protein